MKLLVALAVLAGLYWANRRRRPHGVSLREARELLEVPADATADEIRAAHRKLMIRVHPDAGGTAALASHVNAARDLLVTELNGKRGKTS